MPDTFLITRSALQAYPEDEYGCRERLRALPSCHYVYILHRPCGTPFYVGKGIGDRVFQHVQEARNHPHRLTHKLNTIRAIERRGGIVSYTLAGSFDHDADAHLHEMELIRSIGRYDLGLGPLTNQTDGGEGGFNPSEESRLRRALSLAGDAENHERRIANRFFQALLSVGSVPIKQIGSLGFELLTPHPRPRSPGARQAAALAASAIANRVMIEPRAILPRRLEMEGVTFLLENGVGRDILKSGMADLIEAKLPEHEAFRLTAIGAATISQHVRQDILVSSGVVTDRD